MSEFPTTCIVVSSISIIHDKYTLFAPCTCTEKVACSPSLACVCIISTTATVEESLFSASIVVDPTLLETALDEGDVLVLATVPCVFWATVLPTVPALPPVSTAIPCILT